MIWLEADPLPEPCRKCKEGDCGDCDYAGQRWFLSKKDELILKRKSLEAAVLRMKRQIEEVDRELARLTGKQQVPDGYASQENS